MKFNNVLALLVLAACSAFVLAQGGDVSDYNYVVEILLVVDQPMLDSWLSENGVDNEDRVIEEIYGLIYEANMLYKSFEDYDIYVELRVEDIIFTRDTIIRENLLTDRNGLGVTMAEALDDFFDWLRGNGYRTYDHAMFLSHIDITDENGNTGAVGVAYVGTICTNGGISVFEGAFTYMNAMVIAHELGHSLNMNHDPTRRGNECGDEYVMNAYVVDGQENRWYFSECSAVEIEDFLERLGDGNCLTDTSARPVESPRMGTMLTADEFCQRSSDSLVGLHPSSDSGDALCNTLKCWDGIFTQREITSVEGLDCGSDRQCFYARCQ